MNDGATVDIRDVRPFPDFPWEPTPFAWASLALACLFAFVLILIRRHRARKRRAGDVVSLTFKELLKLQERIDDVNDMKHLLFLASARVRQCFSSLTGNDWLSQPRGSAGAREGLSAPLQAIVEELFKLEQLRFSSSVSVQSARDVLGRIVHAFAMTIEERNSVKSHSTGSKR